MPRRISIVTSWPHDPSRSPDSLHAGNVLLGSLRRRGLFKAAETWLPLSRRGGHGLTALMGFAIVYLLAGPNQAIRPFTTRNAKGLQRVVAAVAGLKACPTQASISRALSSLKVGKVRSFVDQLLVAAPGVGDLLRSRHVLQYDTHGRGWHVLDIDPTVTAFRQRSLPCGEDLPEPERLAMGVPGYTGQKRGELRIRVVPVHHSGAGLWLVSRLQTEKGSVVEMLDTLLRRARSVVVEHTGNEQIIVRGDGEFGCVGAIGACVTAKMDVVTRVTRHALLDEPEVARALASATWRVVPSSGCGPKREAAELGRFLLRASPNAAGTCTSAYARIVVTRIRRAEGEAKTHGVLKDGWQLELFGTTLDAGAWPAEHLAALYFGRAVIEARFAQEDREFGLERTFCKKPAGQEWMIGIGLFLWNVLTCGGVAIDPLPESGPGEPAARRVDAADPLPERASGEPAAPCVDATDVEAPATDVATPVTGPTAALPTRVAASAPETTQDTAPELAGTETSAAAEPPVRLGLTAAEERELWDLTANAYAGRVMGPGWWPDSEARVIRCPSGKPVVLVRADLRADATTSGKGRLIVSARASDCASCPFRATCRAGRKPNPVRPRQNKQLTQRVSTSVAQRAQELLHRRAGYTPTKQPPSPPPPPTFTAPVTVLPGPHTPKAPSFLPASSRNLAREAIDRLAVQFVIQSEPALPRTLHPCLALRPQDRQHRRATWAERRARAGHGVILEVRARDPRSKRVFLALFPEQPVVIAP